MELPKHPEDQSAYLLVDGVTLYELAPNSTLTIGRLDTNNVILDDYKVSREHALLKYNGRQFILIDLASTHGTFFKDEPVTQTLLNYGDDFRIVTHELLVCNEKPANIETSNETNVIPTPSARKLDRRVKLFGGLNEFPLITLVQFLYQERQSGLLMLEEGQKPGPRIYLLDGEIIHVADGEGLSELLTRPVHEQSLFFYFHHETEFPARTIFQSTPNYLMELCHLQDIRDHRKQQEQESKPAGSSSPTGSELSGVEPGSAANAMVTGRLPAVTISRPDQAAA
jgi:pSer/pThr/pTyr-binding forkhead associated (FHA) protein